MNDEHVRTDVLAAERDHAAREAMKKASPVGKKLCLLGQTNQLTCLYYAGQKDLLINFHGGGFCFKSPLDNDTYCAYLSSKGYAVLNLDFTLSYLKHFPAQLKECYDEIEALLNLYPLLASRKIAFVGHSSGANLAASLAIIWGRKKVRVVSAMILNYPFLDLALKPSQRPSYPETFPNWLMEDFANLYCPDNALRQDPFISPLYLPQEEIATYPDCLIVVSHNDRLSADGERFYKMLSPRHAKTRLLKAEARHGFIERDMKNLDYARLSAASSYAKEVTDESLAWLEETLSR